MLNKQELIKELRRLTSAGMSDCLAALQEANWDLTQAVDIVKIKGLNVVSNRDTNVVREGVVSILDLPTAKIMVEINCQTDFVARSKEFKDFTQVTLHTIKDCVVKNMPFSVSLVEDARKTLMSITKENIVVSRWWVQESLSPTAVVCSYLHSNEKIGVLLTLQSASLVTGSALALQCLQLESLGAELAMQVAAMNPLAVSPEQLDTATVERQEHIFKAQLQELNKPEAAWPKILAGKFNKWHQEVCLLNQESVVFPKTSVAQVLEKAEKSIAPGITVVNFIRCQVGEC